MLDNLNVKLFEDFCEFTKPYVYSTDIDPVYPVLKAYYDYIGLDAEHRIWHTFLYVTHYSLKSAEILWNMYPEPTGIIPEMPKLSTGIERRGFRGAPDKVIKNITEFYEASHFNRDWDTGNALSTWLNRIVGDGGKDGWNRVRAAFKEISYNGDWASYKWADLVKHTLGYPITASDIGVGGGGETAGPIPGMVIITGEDWKRCAEDVELQEALLQLAVENGSPLNGLDQLETALCDFNSLYKGRYYAGNDVDMMMEQLDPYSLLWTARGIIPEEYLGEVSGWYGRRKELLKLYKDHGVVDWMNNA